MKPTAYLINTSRGPVVDEAAVIRALQEQWIAGAGLDVFEQEPEVPPALKDLENVVLLPHIGSASVASRTRMAVMAAQSAVAVLHGERPPPRGQSRGVRSENMGGTMKAGLTLSGRFTTYWPVCLVALAAALLGGCEALYQSYDFSEPMPTGLPAQAAPDELWVTSIPEGGGRLCTALRPGGSSVARHRPASPARQDPPSPDPAPPARTGSNWLLTPKSSTSFSTRPTTTCSSSRPAPPTRRCSSSP